ncbi:MAG: class I SAM-dependent methyltransferase [Burkholderiaceae bacterium]
MNEPNSVVSVPDTASRVTKTSPVESLNLPAWVNQYVGEELLLSAPGLWLMSANSPSICIGMAEQLVHESRQADERHAALKRNLGRVLIDRSTRQLRALGNQLNVPLAADAGKAAEMLTLHLTKPFVDDMISADYFDAVGKDMVVKIGDLAQPLLSPALPFLNELLARLRDVTDEDSKAELTQARVEAPAAPVAPIAPVQSQLADEPAPSAPRKDRVDDDTQDSIAISSSLNRLGANSDEESDDIVVNRPNTPFDEFVRHGRIDFATATEDQLKELLVYSADSAQQLTALARDMVAARPELAQSGETASGLPDLGELLNTILSDPAGARIPERLAEANEQRSWKHHFARVRQNPVPPFLISALQHYFENEGYFTGRFLDLGAGAGLVSRFMLKAGWHVVAVDPRTESQESIEVAISESVKRRLEFACAGPAEFNLPEGNDIVWLATSVANSRGALEARLSQIAEAIRPGGYLFVDAARCCPPDLQPDRSFSHLLAASGFVVSLGEPVFGRTGWVAVKI